MDFHLTEASRLADALEHLAVGEIDIVLLDLSLPDSMGPGDFPESAPRGVESPRGGADGQ